MSYILVVEDEIHIQRLIAMLLERAGHKTVCVSSGEQALTYLSTAAELPKLTILDIMMPGIDGMQVLKSIRSNSKWSSLAIVMLTALTEESLVVQGAKLGIKDYIRKPFHPQEFSDRVSKNLQSA